MNGTTWTLFQTIWSSLEQPVINAVGGMVSSLSSWVTGPFQAWALIYLIATLAMAWYAPSDTAGFAFFRHFFRASAVYFIISSAANYNTYFGNLALTSLPQEIGNAISGAAGGAPLTAQAFDNLVNFAFASGLKVFQNIGWFSFKAAVLGILVLLYWFMAIIAVLETFIVYLVSYVVVALGVAVGPLFVALWMFPEARRYFYGWLSVLVSGVVVQIMSVALLTLLITVIGQQLNQLGSSGFASDNLGTQILVILDCAGLFYAGWKIAGHLFGIGTAIAGGVYVHVGRVTQTIQDAVKGLSGGGRNAGGAGPPPSAAAASNAPHAPAFYSFSRPIGKAP